MKLSHTVATDWNLLLQGRVESESECERGFSLHGSGKELVSTGFDTEEVQKRNLLS